MSKVLNRSITYQMAKPHKLHARTTILIIRPSQTLTSTSCHVKSTEPCVYFYMWDFSLIDIMQRFSTQSKLNSAHMTWDHIFQTFTFHFQINHWYMKCLCDKKELMPLHKIKQEGWTFMMANEPLAPYDQNKLSNHNLSITKPLKHIKII
jgi:hypothetical protein